MTFYLAGIDVAKGTDVDDVSADKPYFELGWEVVTTHFDAKRLKKSGIVTDGDTIVTCSGREFLYRSSFTSVLSYSDFAALGVNNGVYSLMERYAGGRIPIDYFDGTEHSSQSRYRFMDADRDIIESVENVAIEHLHQRHPFACLLVRRRLHGAYRNLTDDVARFVLARLLGQYPRVFIVGLGAEHLASDRVLHVDLVTYASLIRSPFCDLVIGTMTGTMQLAAILSRARRCIVVKNYDGYDIDGKNHPVTLGPCIRFSASAFDFVDPGAFLEFIAHEAL